MIRFLEIVSFFLAWGYTFVFFLILRAFLPLRKNLFLKIAAFVVCGYLADSIIYSNDLGSLLGTMALFFAYIVLFYHGTFMEKISVLLVFYPALIAVNYLMLDAGGRLFRIFSQASYDEALKSPGLMLISTVFHTISLLLRLLFWIGAWLILRKFLSKITSHLNTRTWLIIDMVILASFVAIFTIIYFMPEDTAIVYPICGASIFSSFGCMYLAAYIYDSMQTAYRIQQMETQRNYYRERIKDSVGDTVVLNGQQYEVMAIVLDIPTITEGVNSSTETFLSFYLPADTFRAMYPENTLRKMFFDVAAEDQPQAEEMLKDYQTNTDKTLTFTSKSTLIEHYREQTRANTVMGFAISLIIAFVGILNFVNSMVTAIVSRQKEFAMIQSIGMTKRQLRSMLVDEGLYYAGITLLTAYILGAFAVAVGVRMMVAGDYTATFHFTLAPLVICTPILIVFAILIPYICFKNLEKQSIVDRLRATD